MSLLSRFFGSKDSDDNQEENRNEPSLKANTDIENPISFQVLFSTRMNLKANYLTDALRSFHPSMQMATAEIDPEVTAAGKVLGLVGWGKHVIRMVGFDCQMPTDSMEICLQPSHYPDEFKQKARKHISHLYLYYSGYEPSKREQCVAMAAVTGALNHFGALAVLNESGRTSLPTALLADNDTGDFMKFLHALPIPYLYCGFVKYDVEGVNGVWMRTHGAQLLGLPNLSVLASGHDQGSMYFDIFNNIFYFLLESGTVFKAGHTMKSGEDSFFKLRLPHENEYFLESDGDMFVVETISAHKVNPA